MVSGGEEMRGADPVASSTVDSAASCRHLRAMNHGWARRARGWARRACPWIFFIFFVKLTVAGSKMPQKIPHLQ
jgi:hypothetical protein